MATGYPGAVNTGGYPAAGVQQHKARMAVRAAIYGGTTPANLRETLKTYSTLCAGLRWFDDLVAFTEKLTSFNEEQQRKAAAIINGWYY